jgi:hypothetical protein
VLGRTEGDGIRAHFTLIRGDNILSHGGRM